MKKLIYILLLFPTLLMGQIVETKTNFIYPLKSGDTLKFRETFSDSPVNATHPIGWTQGTGGYAVKQLSAESGLPYFNVGDKYLECISDGTIKRAYTNDLSSGISLYFYDGSDWLFIENSVIGLTNYSWFSYSNDYITFDLDAGEAISGIVISSKTNPIFEYTVSTLTTEGLFSSTENIYVDWGDGTTNSYNGTDQAYSKTYTGAGARIVRIYASSEDVMTKYTMTTSGAVVDFDLADLPSGLTYFTCYGSNTVSGDLADLPSGVTVFSCYGSNTVSGDLADLPSGVTSFTCSGSNTVSGDLADLPSALTYFLCYGSNTVSDYTSGRSWASNMSYILCNPISGGLSSTEVDNLIIDLSTTTWTGTTLELKGTNASRTSASDAAVALLLTKGVTVNTN